MKIFLLFPLILGGLLVLPLASAGAQDVAPDVMVKTVTQEVIDVIKQNSNTKAGNAMKISELVETKVVPHFDFTRMTRLAMGRDWRLASPEQQKAIAAEFKSLMVHTYSASLTNYKDQAIEISPVRPEPASTEVTVRSIVRQASAQPVTIDYELAKEPDGWKVYNVTIDGVSLVITYRDTFADIVRTQGVDGVIKALAAKNQRNASAA